MTVASERKLAIECKDVQKTYGTGSVTTKALRGIDLTVPSGELFMLVGPSGCGKTTLISIVAGILNQDRGNVRLFGTDLHALSDDEKTAFRGKRVGFVFQAYNLIPTLTNAENVSIPLLLNGQSRSDARSKAFSLLERVGLKDKIHTYPSNLSGGQQQRVAIARALAHDPQLIVCDEPTSALDHETGKEIIELLRSEKLDGEATLVIVTHDQRIFSYADRIGVMDDGVITKIVEATEVAHFSGH